MARPLAKDHENKRRLILQRAATVFAEEGFDRASVARVAQACEISKANIYHYYTSKDEILFDILDNYLSGLRDRICQKPETGTPEQQFHAVLLDILLAYQGADNEHRLQASSIRHLPEFQQAILRGYQRDLVTHVNRKIAPLAPGLARNPAKLHATTMSVFGMLNWYYMWNPKADAGARKDYANVVCALCLKGVEGI